MHRANFLKPFYHGCMIQIWLRLTRRYEAIFNRFENSRILSEMNGFVQAIALKCCRTLMPSLMIIEKLSHFPLKIGTDIIVGHGSQSHLHAQL